MASAELDELERLVSVMGAIYDTPYLSLWRRVDDQVAYVFGERVDFRDMRAAPDLWAEQRQDLERGHSIGLRKTLLCPLFAVDRSLAGMLMARDPIVLDEDYADRFSFAELAGMVLDRLGPAMMAYDPYAEERAAAREAGPNEAPAGEAMAVAVGAADDDITPAPDVRQTHYNGLTRPQRRSARPRRRPPRAH